MIELEYYSVAYFECILIAEFDARYSAVLPLGAGLTCTITIYKHINT